MPGVEVVFYRETEGESLVLDWLVQLRRAKLKVYVRSVAAITLLAEHGYELRRPLADYLEEGIYELRIKEQHVNYRILYFFHGRQVAVLCHVLTKEGRIPPADLNRALRRKKAFETDPAGHTLIAEV